MMNVKTVAELDRTELELVAVDSAYSEMRYLGYRPKQDSWSSYCAALNHKLESHLKRFEFLAANPNYRIG